MDPVSLALGVAPLCLGALKGAKHAKSKIKLLRHHGREVSRFRKRLKTQVSIFRDESHLLLRDAGIGHDLAAEMIEDLNHPYWAGAELEEQIRGFLGKRYTELKQATEQIHGQVAEFDSQISRLEDSNESSNHGKLAVTADRARRAVGVASKFSGLVEGIETLTDSVNDFRRLRKTAKALQNSGLAFPRQRKALPRTYGLVARHSASFLESLSKTWSCLNSNGVHSTHTAKLFLETDASDSCVNFKMILEYEAILGNVRQHSLLFLRIQSEELSWVDRGLSAPTVLAASSTEAAQRPPKIRRVRFRDPQSEYSANTCPTTDVERQRRRTDLARNLCQARDVCQHVFDCGRALHQSREEGCIGYLVSTDNLTHQLMAAQDKESTTIQTRPYSPASLASIIQPCHELNISVNEQLRLALRLARSVLQYHSTPWWRGNWDLSDLSYFDIDTELSVSLGTLHIDAQLVSKDDTMRMDRVLTHMPAKAPSDDDAQVFCGIRNTTLYSLGVALLQIGGWEPLDATDVVLVRKAAAKPCRLGPRYNDLVNKCLYCDFGFGADLNKPQLQGAVYESVISELEQMTDMLEANPGG